MRISLPVKIIIGLLTAWVVIAPFLYFFLYLSFIFSFIGTENLTQSNVQSYMYDFTSKFIPFFFLIMCTSFLTIGLYAFYITHIILNKTGADVFRVVFGIGMIIFSIIAMPLYYFIYILPQNPPKWALAENSQQAVTHITVQPDQLPPTQ